jgi:hypothetical protein
MSLLIQVEDEIDVCIHLTHALRMMADGMMKSLPDDASALAQMASIIDERLNSVKTVVQALYGRAAQ